MFVTPHGLYLDARVGGAHVLLRLDTASWFTRIPRTLATQIGVASSGRASAVIVLGGVLDLGERAVEVLEGGDDGVAYADLPSGARIAGTAGNDLFADRMLGLDLANGEAWVELPAVLPAHPSGTSAPPIVVVAERPRGSDGHDEAGIVVLPCAFTDGGPAERCILDTGSPPNIALAAAWKASTHKHPKQIPGAATDFEGGLLHGAVQRADVLAIGGFRDVGAPVLVFDRFSILEEEAAYFGLRVAGLVGITTVSSSFTVIDFPGSRVLFYPYDTPHPLGGDAEFQGHGFVLGEAKNNGVSVTVVGGSLAAKAGIASGDVLVGISGSYVLSPYSGIVKDPPGASRTFDFVRRDGATARVTSVAEDLLPR